jgi:transposase
LQLGRKVKPKVIAEQLGVSEQLVYNWARAWRDGGVCALMGGHNGGPPRALSEAIVATALEIARTEPLSLGQLRNACRRFVARRCRAESKCSGRLSSA